MPYSHNEVHSASIETTKGTNMNATFSDARDSLTFGSWDVALRLVLAWFTRRLRLPENDSRHKFRFRQVTMARQTEAMFNGTFDVSVRKDGCVSRRNGLKRAAPLSLPLSGKYNFDVQNVTGDLVKAALLIESGVEGIKVEETKSVSFDLSQNQEVEPENQLLSPEEISQCWWTADFYDRALYQCKKDAKTVLTTEQESAQLLRDTVSLCNQSSSDRLDDQSAVSAMLSTVNIPRGVEKEVIAEIRQMRRKHVRSVLEYSQKIPRHLSLELRERMLSARSLQFSRAHRILARLLGEADVVVRGQ